MSSSDKSISNKPQIFINHVDLSITKDDIQKACEEKNTIPTSITIRNNHDQKSNNVNITFASENEAKILKGTTSTLTVKGIDLKLEEYQTIYSSNIFLKNVHNLTEDQLQEGIRALVKGTFHFTTNFNQVYIYVKEEEDVNTLINKEHKIQGKDVRFEKFLQKKQQTQLYIKFASNPDVKPIEQYFQSTFGTTVTHTSFTMKEKPTPFSTNQNGVSLTFSVTFTDNPKAANEFYNQLKTAQTFLNHPVSVSWKRPENSDDRTLFLKFLKDTVTEQSIRETFSTFGEVQQLDLQDAPHIPPKPKTKCAYLMMASENVCNTVMASGVNDVKVRNLFNLERPSICPYIPKGEMNSYKSATIKTAQNQMVFNQNYQQMAQFTHYPQYMNMNMNMNMMPTNYPMNYNVHQQRKPGYYVQHPQNQFMNNFQQQPKQYKRVNNQNRGNGNYQNNYQGYNNNNNNNYIQNNNNQHQHNRHQQQQQQQHAAKQEFTKTYFQQLVQSDPKKFDEVILDQISKKIVNKLNSDKKYEKYVAENLQQIIDMLTDKEVFEPAELIDLFFDEADMTERIDEAVALLIENAK